MPIPTASNAVAHKMTMPTGAPWTWLTPAIARPIAITSGAAITTPTIVRALFSEPLPNPLTVQPIDNAPPNNPAIIGPKWANR